MARDLEKKTVEVMTGLRIVLVALSEAQTAACKATLAPIMLVPFKGVKEAAGSLTSVMSLLVISSSALDVAALAELSDAANACGAEVVLLDDPPRKDVADRLLEAIRRADARRARADRG